MIIGAQKSVIPSRLVYLKVVMVQGSIPAKFPLKGVPECRERKYLGLSPKRPTGAR